MNNGGISTENPSGCDPSNVTFSRGPSCISLFYPKGAFTSEFHLGTAIETATAAR
jgi:hypothetical protein